ncbi:Ankyrin repeat domain-containing protein 54, partial [Hondaea fermentalgiana]
MARHQCPLGLGNLGTLSKSLMMCGTYISAYCPYSVCKSALEKFERLGKIFVRVQPQLDKVDKALMANVLSRYAALEMLSSTGGAIEFTSEEDKGEFSDALESDGMGGIDTEALIQLLDDLDEVIAQSDSGAPPETREEALQRILPTMPDLNHELRSFKEALGKSLEDLVALHEAIHVPESCFDIMYMRASGNASDDSMETKLLQAAKRSDFETCKRILQTHPEIDPLSARDPPIISGKEGFDPDQLQASSQSSLDYLITAIARIQPERNAYDLTLGSKDKEMNLKFKAAKLKELQSAREVVALILERVRDTGKFETAGTFARALRSFDVKTLQLMGRNEEICHGKTPLHLAIEMKCPEMVAVLCENGAESDDKALLDTTELGQGEILQILKNDGKAFPERYRGELDRTLLHLACNKPDAGDDNFVQMLIQMNVAVNEVDMIGRTALHNAAAMGNLSAVRSLLEAGADETLPTRREGSTVIHEAAKMGRISVLQFVLKNSSGETVDAVDMQGRTPLCYAFKRRKFLELTFYCLRELQESAQEACLRECHLAPEMEEFAQLMKERYGKSDSSFREAIDSVDALRGLGSTREMRELASFIRKCYLESENHELSKEGLRKIEDAPEMKVFVGCIKKRYRDLDASSRNFKAVELSEVVRDLHLLPLMRDFVYLILRAYEEPSMLDPETNEETSKSLEGIESSSELSELAALIKRRIDVADTSCETANEIRVFKSNLKLVSGSAFSPYTSFECLPNFDGELLSYFPQDICQDLQDLESGSKKDVLEGILRDCFEELFVEIRKADAVLGILLDAGADIDHVDDQGNPAFDDDYRIEYFKTKEKELKAALEKRSKLAHDQPIFKGKIVHHAVHAAWVQQGLRFKACRALAYWVILLILLTLVAIRYSGRDVYESFSIQASIVNRMSSGDAGTLEDVNDLDSWNDYVENVFVEAIWPSESDLHAENDSVIFGEGLVLLGRPRYRVFANQRWETRKLVSYESTEDRHQVWMEVAMVLFFLGHFFSEIFRLLVSTCRSQKIETGGASEQVVCNGDDYGTMPNLNKLMGVVVLDPEEQQWWLCNVSKTKGSSRRVVSKDHSRSFALEHLKWIETWGSEAGPRRFNVGELVRVSKGPGREECNGFIVSINECDKRWTYSNAERDVYIDVSDLMWLSTIRQYLLGGVVFLCYLKTLEYLRVAATFAVPVMIIIGMLVKLMSFLAILAVFVLAFGIFDYVVFGLKYAPVKSVMKALVFTLRGALGELDFDGKYEMDQVVGTGMTMLTAVLLVILLLNLLIAVMSEAYEDVKATAEARWCYRQYM